MGVTQKGRKAEHAGLVVGLVAAVASIIGSASYVYFEVRKHADTEPPAQGIREQLNEARRLLSDGAISLALAAFGRVDAHARTNEDFAAVAEANLGVGECFIELGRTADAEQQLSKMPTTVRGDLASLFASRTKLLKSRIAVLHGDSRTGRELARLAIQILPTSANVEIRLECRVALARAAALTESKAEVISILSNALEEADAHHLVALAHDCCVLIARTYALAGELGQSRSYIRRAKNYEANDMSLRSKLESMFLSIGFASYEGQYGNATKLVQQATALLEKSESQVLRGMLHLETARLWFDQKKYTEAIESATRSIEVFSQASFSTGVGIATRVRIDASLDDESIEVSIKEYLSLISEQSSRGEDLYSAQTRLSLARACLIAGDYDSAVAQLLAAKETFAAYSDHLNLAVSYGIEGGMFAQRGQYYSAIDSLTTALSIYGRMGDRDRSMGALAYRAHAKASLSLEAIAIKDIEQAERMLTECENPGLELAVRQLIVRAKAKLGVEIGADLAVIAERAKFMSVVHDTGIEDYVAGTEARLRGDHKTAIARLTTAKDKFDDAQDGASCALSALELFEIYLYDNNTTAAMEEIAFARKRYSKHKNEHGLGLIMEAEARLESDVEASVAKFKTATDTFERLEHWGDFATCKVYLAEKLLQAGQGKADARKSEARMSQLEQAELAVGASLSLFSRNNTNANAPYAWLIAGQVASELYALNIGQIRLEKCVELSKITKRRDVESQGLACLGALYQSAKRYADAIRCYQSALSLTERPELRKFIQDRIAACEAAIKKEAEESGK